MHTLFIISAHLQSIPTKSKVYESTYPRPSQFPSLTLPCHLEARCIGRIQLGDVHEIPLESMLMISPLIDRIRTNRRCLCRDPKKIVGNGDQPDLPHRRSHNDRNWELPGYGMTQGIDRRGTFMDDGGTFVVGGIERESGHTGARDL